MKTLFFFINRNTLLLILLLSCVWPPHEAFSATEPKVDRQVLPNGLVVMASQEHTLPFVTLRFLSDAGARHDPEGQAGLANLTIEGLLLGTRTRTAREINDRIDYLGVSLSVSCSFDYAVVDFKVLKDNWEQGIDLLLEVITSPTFPEEEMRRQIRAIQSALIEQEDQPGVIAQKAFRRALFEYSPYGHAVEGTIETLDRISTEQVRAFYDRYFNSQSGILVIVGDVDNVDIQGVVERLSRWDAEGDGTAEEQPQQVFAPSATDVRTDRPVSQANIVLGHPGIARANPDFPAVMVMNEILGGGGFTSRLLRRIRVEKGLAYSVSSYFEARRFPAAFQVVLQTKNDSAREAIRIARQEMRRLQNEPVSDQELDTAKNYLIGSFPLRYASQSGLAQLLGHIEYYHLGLDYFSTYADRIRRIQKKDVLEAARKYLQPDKAIVSIVADMQAAGMKVSP
jgi:zinc protease